MQKHGKPTMIIPEVPTPEGPYLLSRQGRTRTRFGEWLTATLSVRNMSQEEFADRVGTTQGAVSHWTVDRRPSSASCQKIAEVLDIPVAEVMTYAGHITADTPGTPDHPTRARLHVLIDTLDPELLAPHLAILERTAKLLKISDRD